MTALASEYSVTPANAVFYMNAETIVLADAAAALGYPLWQIVDEGGDNVWYYGFFGSGSTPDKETFETDFYNTMWQCENIIKSRGYYPYFMGEVGFGESVHLNTKDSRIYIPNSSGGTWCLTEYRRVTW